MDHCSPCGTSCDYPTHVEVVTLGDCSRDVLGHLESYGISGDEAIHSELKLLLAQAGILFPLFCAAVLNCATDLVCGPQALSYRYSLPLRPSTNVVPLLCETKMQFSTSVVRQERDEIVTIWD